MRKKIATIGGGTGQYTLLRGLKNYDIDLTAVVSMVDDGGKSTKRLMVEFGILPPGDLRNCLVALVDESKLKDLKELFEYRFPELNKNENGLGGHSLGNLILTALIQQHGDIGKAVEAAAKILNISGRVLPVSLTKTNLYGKTIGGKILNGQAEVSYNIQKADRIKELYLEPKSFVFEEAAKALRESDVIVICPGDLYGSIIPNFLIEGVNQAIKDSKAKLVYVCNLVTKQGTYGFKASDFVKEIEKYLGGKEIDTIVLNTKKPTQKIVDKYKGEDSEFVEPDIGNLKKKIVETELLVEYKSDGKIIARHEPQETAQKIIELL